VLGGVANIAREYATKRYRSNLINWGMVPFLNEKDKFEVGDYVYVEGIREAIERSEERIMAKHISGGKVTDIVLSIGGLTPEEKKIILSGCLINFNKNKGK
jgi:aconitate hydratase